MTHNELLARIQSDYEENKHFRDQPKWKPFAALSAVVELHKPELIESGEDSIFVCSTCNPEWFWENPYPCATIQEIEKAMK